MPSCYTLTAKFGNDKKNYNQPVSYSMKIIAFGQRVEHLIVVSLLLGVPIPSFAGQEVARIPFINAPSGTAGLGGGFRFGNNQYISSGESDEVPLDLIPLYLYEGKYLFAQGTSFGVHFFKNDKFSISALARWRFQSKYGFSPRCMPSN